MPMGGWRTGGSAEKRPLLLGSPWGSSGTSTTRRPPGPSTGGQQVAAKATKAPTAGGTWWGTGEAMGTRGRGAVGWGSAMGSTTAPALGARAAPLGRERADVAPFPNEGS